MGKKDFKEIKTSNVVKANHVERKNFSYSLPGVNLEFQLRTDVDTELKGFLKLLEKAVEDLQLIIKQKK